jgi:hypothetical protein
MMLRPDNHSRKMFLVGVGPSNGQRSPTGGRVKASWTARLGSLPAPYAKSPPVCDAAELPFTIAVT